MYGKTALSNLMETRCEHCHSRFRVTDQQLQRALGQVRCGECGEVFNAMVNLQSLSQEDMAKIPCKIQPCSHFTQLS